VLRLIFRLITALILVCASWIPSVVYADMDESDALPALIISEIKVNNDTAPGGFNEFIELYNTSEETIDLSNFLVAYFNSSTPGSDPSSVISLESAGELESGKFIVFSKVLAGVPHISDSLALPFTSLRDDGGCVVVLEVTDNPGEPTTTEVVDRVCWHKPTASAPTPAHAFDLPPASKTLQRLSSATEPLPKFTAGWHVADPNPFDFLVLQATEEPGEEDETDIDVQLPPEVMPLTCEGVMINELLPNPAGADKGSEYIELYNPTDEVISLATCELQTSANSKTYVLPDIEMQPLQYLALYDSQTGLTLPNANGGSVWLSTSKTELQEVVYPGGMEDDTAWAWFDGVGWEKTYKPTPGSTNIRQPVKPCPVGQIRNLETNRCVSALSLSTSRLVPCQPGQERNPATNRCRSVLSASANLAPCKAGQERNPATNRCRNVLSSNTALKPCASGQERNPETNRCRKIASATASNLDVKDIAAVSEPDTVRWYLVGAAVAAAGGYGLYEWRKEFRDWLRKTRQRLPFIHGQK
jgi:hypothetical protein